VTTPRHSPLLRQTARRGTCADVGVVPVSQSVVEEVVATVAGISTQRPGRTT
jgi:hypothetical protein